MNSIPLPQPKEAPPFIVSPQMFSEEERMWIKNLAQLYPSKDGGTGANNTVDEVIRRSRITWIFQDDRSNWLYEKIGHFVHTVNGQHFGFDLNAMEAVQFTEYQGNGEHYGWHKDSMPSLKVHRKLSMSVLIDKPEDGGAFEIQSHGNMDIDVVQLNEGDAVFFPSYMPHRVAPTITGTRRSVVVWFSGPRFR